MKAIASVLTGLAVVFAAVMTAQAAEPTGTEVFNTYCVHCHGDTNEAAGTLQLARTRGETMAVLTERTDLKPEYIEYVVRHGLRSMPPFAPTELTDAKLKALTNYLTK